MDRADDWIFAEGASGGSRRLDGCRSDGETMPVPWLVQFFTDAKIGKRRIEGLLFGLSALFALFEFESSCFALR